MKRGRLILQRTVLFFRSRQYQWSCNICVHMTNSSLDHLHMWKILWVGSIARKTPGGSKGGPPHPTPPPLFLDQTEAPRLEKNWKKFLETSPPVSRGLDDRHSPPPSEGLDPALYTICCDTSSWHFHFSRFQADYYAEIWTVKQHKFLLHLHVSTETEREKPTCISYIFQTGKSGCCIMG